MEDKLKTLKDLQEEVRQLTGGLGENPTSNVIRAEAIKWISEIDETKDDNCKWRCPEWGDFSEVKEWIKHFFNLKEEDLEEKKT